MLNLSNEEIDILSNNQALRVALCKKSFAAFIVFYQAHKFELDFAEGHIEIIKALDGDDEFIAFLCHRGYGKSAYVKSFLLWRLIGDDSSLNILVRDTQDNATFDLGNIRKELETNKRLQTDFNINLLSKKKEGVFESFNQNQITVNGSTILAKGTYSKVRGINFSKTEKIGESVFSKEERIGTIVIDDGEDVYSARTAEGRKKYNKWYYSEIMPARKQGILAKKTKVVIIGNLVHEDCHISKMTKLKNVKVVKIPLLDKKGKISFPALYPNMAAVNKEKAKVLMEGDGNGRITWHREYLLEIISEEDQIIKDTDIQYYKPEMLQKKIISSAVGVDFAISEKEKADSTTMVKGVLINNDYAERRLLILADPLCEKINVVEMISKAKYINSCMIQPCKWFVESNAYQMAGVQLLERNGIIVKPSHTSKDKRTNLMCVSMYIKTGVVLFPETGCEELLGQLLGFGTESHDDLVDGLIRLIDGVLNKDVKEVFFA